MKKIDCYRANLIWKKYVSFINDRLLILYTFSLKFYSIFIVLKLFEHEPIVCGVFFSLYGTYMLGHPTKIKIKCECSSSALTVLCGC